ncbi:VOC family protein [uncultured Bosea sp.]|uniref:VOC family protein n=1 Tax=uncultured Bosea sp. TaxID=211457 RepID=UPI0025D3BA12|nr:VOC family protein [uncultured Bosea sp.]
MPLSIDHIVIAVTDLDAAIRDYTTLGFTVLPGGEHPRGSRNALVVLADGAYLEIIAFPRPVPDFRWWQVLDRAGPGLVDFAVLPDDLDADLARARAAGIVMDGPIDGGRLQPDGTRIAWRSARPPEPDIPFLCTDVTPRGLRVPEGPGRRHANGVTGVAGVTVAVQDLATSVARYRALLGREPIAVGGVPGLGFGIAQFRIGRQTLSLTEPHGPAAASLGEHLVRRGQGVCAISFYGPEDARIDDGLAHGARLEIVRDV